MSDNNNNVSNEGLFKVERIVSKRIRKGVIEYFVKWDEYPETANTWEPIENLIDECHHLIREFENFVDLEDSSNHTSNHTLLSDIKPETYSSDFKDFKDFKDIKMSSESTQSANNMISDIVIESDNDSEKTEIDSLTDEELNQQKVSEKQLDDDKQQDMAHEEYGSNDIDSLVSQIEDLITEDETTAEDNTIERLIEMPPILTQEKNCTQVLESNINSSADNALYTGFIDGLTPRQIIASSKDEQGRIYFWMQWSNNHISVVLAEEANIRCPQIVIQWYENRIHFE